MVSRRVSLLIDTIFLRENNFHDILLKIPRQESSKTGIETDASIHRIIFQNLVHTPCFVFSTCLLFSFDTTGTILATK